MTQIVTYGVNATVFGWKLHRSVRVSSTLLRSGRRSYSARYSRETGSEGCGRSLETAYTQESSAEVKVFGLTPGVRIDLEEPARTLRSITWRMGGRV